MANINDKHALTQSIGDWLGMLLHDKKNESEFDLIEIAPASCTVTAIHSNGKKYLVTIQEQ